jgi:murein DD-endopeptidase MepM/ murein hydrolase activator NlpD
MIRPNTLLSRWALAVTLMLYSAAPFSQTAYKYKDANGQWIFTDKAPPSAAHDDSISLGHRNESLNVTIARTNSGTTTRLTAINDCLCVATYEARIQHSDDPNIPNDSLYRAILQPHTQELMVSIGNAGVAAKDFKYQWAIVLGSPQAQHRPPRPYRAPFAVGATFVISQAYPSQFTHTSPDSQYAVDIALPDGTQVYAAREGTVINVRHDAFRGGVSAAMMDQANVIEILHDDGTIAMYAHLHWDSIRVHIGEHVDRGEYIANSGNTGFSSGPHLHFCVVRNAGFTPVSVPIVFAGPSNIPVTPETQRSLTAY